MDELASVFAFMYQTDPVTLNLIIREANRIRTERSCHLYQQVFPDKSESPVAPRANSQ